VTNTATLAAARAHARRQAGAMAASGPTIPSTSASDLPSGVRAEDVVWDEVIGGGGYASRVLRRGSVVRLTDLDGDACVNLLVYNAASPIERLNVADTVKVQWQAYLGPGALLLSDMGRVLMTIVADTSARHDCLCGCSRGGSPSGPAPGGRELLALAAAKHGLGRADVAPNINLFKGVRIETDGSLTFDGTPAPEAYVELRAEMPVLVLVANTPHPLDERDEYTVTPVRSTAWRAPHPSADDPFRMSTPERERAFQNTDEALR
jgi:urea carboxylase-associated protein 2